MHSKDAKLSSLSQLPSQSEEKEQRTHRRTDGAASSRDPTGDLYKTTHADLNRHVRGVCNHPNGSVNVASIAQVYCFMVFRDFCTTVCESLI